MSGACINACPTGALQMAGREISASELMVEIEKDHVFYDQSQGGVTFSGGEPLLQPDFLRRMLELCRERDIHTVVDTSGYAPWKHLDLIRHLVDLFFFDLKIMDDDEHQRMTGVSNQIILENLKNLTKQGHQVEVRLPVIPGFNDTEANKIQTIDFLSSLPGVKRISLLPFHKMGAQKYTSLNRESPMPDIQPPSQEVMQRLQKEYADSGFQVNLGG
jgi:pyruvate formate lyase activating enzyme